MLRQPIQTALLLPLALLAIDLPPVAKDREDKTDLDSAEREAQDSLTQFDKGWKDYTNEPNFDDPRWKLKMETLVKLAKAGRSAISLLEGAAKEDSPWAPHTRQLATHILGVWRDTPAVRDAWANYDLSQMDLAKEGKQAPDFALTDAGGESYRLSECRGKKTIVVTFIIQDI